MCGIVGFINRECLINKENDDSIILNMLKVQEHRGPDDYGIEPINMGDGRNGRLGFNRLSILDLSNNGHQPMKNKNGKVMIAFNGEIYNAGDYRQGLIEKGYDFRSTTDTEVLLYLYEEYGIEKTLSLIVGMFAFVIIDYNTNKIFAARDRMGEKPFYYYQKGDTILFGSEVKTFFKHPAFEAVLNETVLDEFLVYRCVVGEETLLRDVKVLEPAHYLEFARDEVIIKQYYYQHCSTKISINPKKELEKRLKKSVNEQLISDVPIGIMLSGGIDSSLIAKYASESADLQSFSVIFDDENYSEEKWIDCVTRLTGSRAYKYIMREDDFVSNLVKCIWHCDFPLNHPNSLGVYILCKNARERVTVLLGGEGSDELLGGYAGATISRTDYLLRKLLGPLYKKFNFCKKFNKFSGEMYSYDKTYVLNMAFTNKEQLISIRPNADIEKVLNKRLNILQSISGNSYHKYSEYDQKTYLVDILNRVDKMSMASSMELRCPFLSPNVTDYVRTLNQSFLVVPTFSKKRIVYNGKKILKRISCSLFGKKFTYRDKMGWPLPLKDYFSGENMKKIVETTILPGIQERGLLKGDVVIEWWNNLDTLSPREVETLWIAFSFEIWAQIFLDNKGTIPQKLIWSM